MDSLVQKCQRNRCGILVLHCVAHPIFGGWDLGATIGWIWDRNPTIYLDDDLRGLLASGVNFSVLTPG